jgi:hypothetical protein
MLVPRGNLTLVFLVIVGAELTCLVILLRYKVHHGHWMLQCVHASDVIDLK